MIVTCENCGARYKLDDLKVSGRGVKITCPKCRHIFVVFRDQGDAPRTDAGGPMSLVPEMSFNTRTLPPLPPPRVPSRDVNTLDFRKVGIASWKVKVKIGLVYDFSDYKTLRKYIADGRVTASDLLSSDGKIWTPIGDIPDLERHFVDVYEAAEERKAAEESAKGAPEENPFSDEGPTGIHGMADVATNLGNAARAESVRAENSRSDAFGSGPTTSPGLAQRTLPPQDRGSAGRTIPPTERMNTSPRNTLPPSDRTTGPVYGEGAARRKKRPQAKKAAPAEESASNNAGPAIAVVAILVLLGGWLYANRGSDSGLPPPAPAPATAATDPAATTGPSFEQIRKEMNDEIRNARDAAPPDPIDVPTEPQLIPVRPGDIRTAKAPANTTAPTSKTVPSALPSPTAPTGGTGMSMGATSASDNAAVGDDDWSRGDYAGALAAYRKAASMDSSNATYLGKVGRAQYKTGDLTSAHTSLSAARKGGYTEASKWLGNIARDQGDVAGAIGNYNDYLKSSPPDAAEIQREIKTLTGS